MAKYHTYSCNWIGMAALDTENWRRYYKDFLEKLVPHSRGASADVHKHSKPRRFGRMKDA